MHNVYNVHMPQAMCDVASGIGIGIGAAAADSIGYRAPARYRSNPSGSVKCCCFFIHICDRCSSILSLTDPCLLQRSRKCSEVSFSKPQSHIRESDVPDL